MKVDINRIEEITSQLLLKLKENRGSEIELSNDFFWEISSEELYNPYEEPKNISLGQLSFDLEEIMKLKVPHDGIPYDLKCIGNILIALSIENPLAF